jgi:hypothetical protein
LIAFLAILSSLQPGIESSASLAKQEQIGFVSTDFSPRVVPIDQQESVSFYAHLTGNPTRVVLEYNQPLFESELELFDDGFGADITAGDRVYSGSIPAEQITSILNSNDVFRPFIGFLNLFDGSSSVGRGNIFAEVLTPDIPSYSLFPLAQDVQYTDHLVNIVDPFFFTNSGINFIQVTQRFYQFFADEYDFINIIALPSFFENRFHFQVKNDVLGIGLNIFDDSFKYGSFGKLKGISMFPNTVFHDGASEGFQHELGHQWINFLTDTPFESGIAHWPFSSTASGIMGFSIPPTGQGGDFKCNLVQQGDQVILERRDDSPEYSDMDLYLMGLLPPDQVGTQFIFPDQSFEAHDEILSNCDGQPYFGELIRVEIEDVISVHGPRIPAASAPQTFKVATIIVSQDGLLSADAMDFYTYFSQRAELQEMVPFQEGFLQGLAKPFFISTRGLGMIDTRVAPF